MHDRLYPQDRQTHAVMLSDLAVDVQAQGRLAEAIGILQQALALQEALDPPPLDEIAWTRGTIGYVYSKLDQMEESARWLRSAHDLFVTQPEDEQNRFELVYHLNNLGGIEMRLEHYGEAQPFLRKALEVSRAMHGEDHAMVGRAYSMLGSAILMSGDVDGAAPLIENGTAIMKRALGPQHVNTARALGTLATLRREQGRLDDAIALSREALTICRNTLGDEHSRTAERESELARLLLDQGGASEALALIDEALATYRAEFEPTHAKVLEQRALRASALVLLGRDAEAAREMRGLVDALTLRHGPDNEWTERAVAVAETLAQRR